MMGRNKNIPLFGGSISKILACFIVLTSTTFFASLYTPGQQQKIKITIVNAFLKCWFVLRALTLALIPTTTA